MVAKMTYVGSKRIDWLAQISTDDGMAIETIGGKHRTEALALEAATREIRRRSKLRERGPR